MAFLSLKTAVRVEIPLTKEDRGIYLKEVKN